MGYAYERLGDRGFQMLCQSLVVRQFAGTQCMPLGMPDGGRDITADGGAVVFQVKFSASPRATNDPVGWLKRTIKADLAKLPPLVRRGATRYIVVTNVPGTPHLEVGQIDRVQEFLDENCPIPAMCWWADDVDRRLDGDFDVKMRYPQLLDGQDMLRMLAERAVIGDTSEADRLQRALDAYLRIGFAADRQVRFRQAADLAAPLFDLFIDVPASPTASADDHRRTAWRPAVYPDGPRAPRVELGAAEVLLNPQVGASFPLITVEGAPGQGKSTLAQYMAQVHRVRLLKLTDQIKALPEAHRNAPVMLPIKMELRDLAVWLSGGIPWDPGESAHGQQRTVEAALAAHVARMSGGHRFDVTDLAAVMAYTPVIVLLDALDEVADLQARAYTVAAVEEAAARLVGTGTRIVVTSRPTALPGAPSLDPELFWHVSLLPIRRELALDYANRWAQACELSSERAGELREVLRSRLMTGHCGELARNAMQLSILLTLIRQRGDQLPERRTELYDKYVDLYFDREGEKVRAVGAHRELFLDLHRHLAFELHARAEHDGATGRFSSSELRATIVRRLSHLGLEPDDQDRALVDDMLIGTAERVFFLAARTEGLYEFENQPMREYFAAQYLYKTTEYRSATEQVGGGDLHSRFAGIAPNPFWGNVARFMAGCFQFAELAGLADHMADLIADYDGPTEAYLRQLAVWLLGDWVFDNNRRAARRLIEAVFDSKGRVWASATSRAHRVDRMVGPDAVPSLSAGVAVALLDALWPDIVATNDQPRERVLRLCYVVDGQYAIRALVAERWHAERRHRDGAQLDAWFRIGQALGVFERNSVIALAEALGEDPSPGQLLAVSRGGASLARINDAMGRAACIAVLSSPDIGLDRLSRRTFAGHLSELTRPAHWIAIADGRRRRPDSLYGLRRVADDRARWAPPGLAGLRQAVSDVIGPESARHNWEPVVSMLREQFGPSPADAELTVISARFHEERGILPFGENFFHPDHGSWDRAEALRRNADDGEWWDAQLPHAVDDIDRYLWALGLVVWASAPALAQCLPAFGEAVSSLPGLFAETLIQAAWRSLDYAEPDELTITAEQLSAAALPAMATAALLARLPGRLQTWAVMNLILPAEPDAAAASSCLNVLIDNRTALAVAELIDAAVVCHEAGGIPDVEFARYMSSTDDLHGASLQDWIREVRTHASELPPCFLPVLYEPNRAQGPATESVLALAKRQHWFGPGADSR